jgi:hypothetical protein
LRDQRDDVLGGDFIQGHFAKRRQDMNPQHRLVGAPASFICLDEWQIFIGNKIAQAWNSPQLLTTCSLSVAECSQTSATPNTVRLTKRP